MNPRNKVPNLILNFLIIPELFLENFLEISLEKILREIIEKL